MTVRARQRSFADKLYHGRVEGSEGCWLGWSGVVTVRARQRSLADKLYHGRVEGSETLRYHFLLN